MTPEESLTHEMLAAEPGDRAVVILSGGPDSAVVLFMACERGYDVCALTFDYGQLAEEEIKCAMELAKLAGAKWVRVDLTGMKAIYSGATSLTDDKIGITSSFSPQIIVPFRNGVMISIAVAYGNAIGAKAVFYGAQKSDAENYPDCRQKFVKAMENAARNGTDTDIRIEAPLISLNKCRVLKLGESLGVPFEKTWSCYRSGAKHCGRCESCLNRKGAFAEAGIKDPTEYSEWVED